MLMGQRQGVGHIGQLKAKAAEIVLSVTLTFHQLPLIGRLTGEIVEMPDVTNLQFVQTLQHLGAAHRHLPRPRVAETLYHHHHLDGVRGAIKRSTERPPPGRRARTSRTTRPVWWRWPRAATARSYASWRPGHG